MGFCRHSGFLATQDARYFCSSFWSFVIELVRLIHPTPHLPRKALRSTCTSPDIERKSLSFLVEGFIIGCRIARHDPEHCFTRPLQSTNRSTGTFSAGVPKVNSYAVSFELRVTIIGHRFCSRQIFGSYAVSSTPQKYKSAHIHWLLSSELCGPE